MIAETVYPITETLSRNEKIKLIELLQVDIQVNKPLIQEMTDKQIRRQERIKWLKQHVFYAPKIKKPLLE